MEQTIRWVISGINATYRKGNEKIQPYGGRILHQNTQRYE